MQEKQHTHLHSKRKANAKRHLDEAIALGPASGDEPRLNPEGKADCFSNHRPELRSVVAPDAERYVNLGVPTDEQGLDLLETLPGLAAARQEHGKDLGTE